MPVVNPDFRSEIVNNTRLSVIKQVALQIPFSVLVMLGKMAGFHFGKQRRINSHEALFDNIAGNHHIP